MKAFIQYFKDVATGTQTIAKGLGVTLKIFLFKKPITLQYPEQRPELSKRSRMRLFNDVDDCISCNLCAQVCPVDCIYISSIRRDKTDQIERTSNGTPKRLMLTQFVIDTNLCCYCGLCTEVCPTDCLTHTTDFEFSEAHTNGMKYDYLDKSVQQWKPKLQKTRLKELSKRKAQEK